MAQPFLEQEITVAAPLAELRADERMPQLALAFEMDLALAGAAEPKWPMGTTIAFALTCGLALWAAIASAVHLIWQMN